MTVEDRLERIEKIVNEMNIKADKMKVQMDAALDKLGV